MRTFGTREALVFFVVAALLAASLVGAIQIADVRRAENGGDPIVDTAQAPGDWDGDGIPDAQDACGARPETFNGFQDQDGCPDVVTTTRAS